MIVGAKKAKFSACFSSLPNMVFKDAIVIFSKPNKSATAIASGDVMLSAASSTLLILTGGVRQSEGDE